MQSRWTQVRFFLAITVLSLLCIRKFESWFSVYLEKSASLSTLGPNYSIAVIWSRSVLTCLVICMYSGSPQSSPCSTVSHQIAPLICMVFLPWKHLKSCSQIYTTYSLAGAGKWVIGRWHNVRKVCLCVALLREFWSSLYSYVCPDYGGRLNTFYWKSFLCSEWMLANYHPLVLHILYYTPKYLPSINILGCYVILGLLVRVRESSGKIGKGMKKLLRPCLLTRKMKPEVIVHFRWLHWLGQQIFL